MQVMLQSVPKDRGLYWFHRWQCTTYSGHLVYRTKQVCTTASVIKKKNLIVFSHLAKSAQQEADYIRRKSQYYRAVI